MIFVGVPNSEQKSELAARLPMGRVYVQPMDLAWDCGRHIAFLNLESNADRDMLGSDYARYLRDSGRDEASTLQRCRRFLALRERWRHYKSTRIWAVVTHDGLRLDGSHRAAVAVAEGYFTVACAVVPYLPADTDWREVMLALRAEKLHKGDCSP